MARWRLYGLEDLDLKEVHYVYEKGVTVVYTFFQDNDGFWRWNRAVERQDINRRGFISERGFSDKSETIKDAFHNAAAYDKDLK
jgi:hypothetical protein